MSAAAVYVFSERKEVALELLTPGLVLAEQIGAGVVAVLPEHVGEDEAREWCARGAERVLLLPPTPAGSRATDTGLEALWSLAREATPEVILAGATWDGVEVTARLAQRLGVGCASDCLAIERVSGELIVQRRTLGKFLTKQRIRSRPAIVSIAPNRFEPPPAGPARGGDVERLAVSLPPSRVRVTATSMRERNAVRIEDSEIVVAVGRGLRSQADLALVERLATVLGGAVAASRPLTDDLQWLSADIKVGLSGRTVQPRLYIACGISGQVEHLVGMRDSGVVVAINTDPDAPIRKESDYVIVGDLYEILPALMRIVERCLEEKST